MHDLEGSFSWDEFLYQCVLHQPRTMSLFHSFLLCCSILAVTSASCPAKSRVVSIYSHRKCRQMVPKILHRVHHPSKEWNARTTLPYFDTSTLPHAPYGNQNTSRVKLNWWFVIVLSRLQFHLSDSPVPCTAVNGVHPKARTDGEQTSWADRHTCSIYLSVSTAKEGRSESILMIIKTVHAHAIGKGQSCGYSTGDNSLGRVHRDYTWRHRMLIKISINKNRRALLFCHRRGNQTLN